MRRHFGIRTAILIGALALPAASPAQEHIGVSQQAQTMASSVAIPGTQAATCGAAPSAPDLNVAVAQARAMFPDPSGFNAHYNAMIHDPCPRSRIAAYLVHLMANNHWRFAQ